MPRAVAAAQFNPTTRPRAHFLKGKFTMLVTNAKTAHAGHHTHTPGPWHAQGRYIVPADNGPSIGSAIALKAPSLKKQPDYDAQAFVNARLMAAAPDMYDLLCRALNMTQDRFTTTTERESLESDITALLVNLERPL